MSKEPNSVYIRDVALASRSTIEPEGDESGIQPSSVNRLALVIPQEIIDLIIDEVASDMGDSVRRETLYACSLSCQSFRTRVVYHTYSKIKIVETSSIDHSGIRLKKLLEVLKNNPLIGAYVRVLEVGSFITPDFVSSCLWDNTHLPSILSCLQGVQRLILTETGERPMSWTSLHSDVVGSLLVIIQGSSLHSLEIEGFWDFPLDCILRCKELEELAVIRAGNSTALHSLPSDHGSPPLKRLKVDDSRTVLLPLLSIPRLLSQLQTLQVCLKSLEDFIPAGDLLIQTAQTLNELHLFFHMMLSSVSGSQQCLSKIINQGTLVSLKKMTVECTIDYFIASFPDILRDVVRLQDSNGLRSLTLKINWEDIPFGHESSIVQRNANWEFLDDSLADSRYTCLQDVNLILTFGLISWFPLDTQTISQKKIRPLTEHLFPKLMMSGRTVVNVSIHVYYHPRSSW